MQRGTTGHHFKIFTLTPTWHDGWRPPKILTLPHSPQFLWNFQSYKSTWSLKVNGRLRRPYHTYVIISKYLLSDTSWHDGRRRNFTHCSCFFKTAPGDRFRRILTPKWHRSCLQRMALEPFSIFGIHACNAWFRSHVRFSEFQKKWFVGPSGT